MTHGDIGPVKKRRAGIPKLRPYLDALGWIASHRTQSAIDRDGNPIPWYTYPAIAFLAKRTSHSMNVFEFGSGNSTHWWAARVKHVTSVEHEAAWAERVRPSLPANTTYSHIPLVRGGDYCRAAQASGGRFDVIVVDGRDRVECAVRSVDALTESGVIIWDNSERGRYQPGQAVLTRQGFRRLDFEGLVPILPAGSVTTIFYRTNNCLGI